MALDFEKEWAQGKDVPYPTDAQRKRGLAFLGDEPPTFELHDAMFKELDKKDKWLFDQIKTACEKYGQDVTPSLGNGSRDALYKAIANAVVTQRKADEGGYGIVKMADGPTVMAGSEYNMAVSPKHLSEYVKDNTKWDNIKDKPQTALRWATWGEVTGKPTWGSAAWKSASDFDEAGAAGKVYSTSVQRDRSYRAGFLGGDIYRPYIEHSDNGVQTIVDLARRDYLDKKISSLGSAAYANSNEFDPAGSAKRAADDAKMSSVQRDRSRRAGFVGGNISSPYIEYYDGNKSEVVIVARSKDLGSAAYRSESDFDPAGAASDVYRTAVQRDRSFRAGFFGGDVTKPYIEYSNGSDSKIVFVARTDDIGSAAKMFSSRNSYLGLTGDYNEVLNTKQFVDYRNDLKTPGNIGSYVIARKINDDNHKNMGDTVPGYLLFPSSCSGRNDTTGERNTLPGTWKACGWSAASGYDAWESKTTLWVRVS